MTQSTAQEQFLVLVADLLGRDPDSLSPDSKVHELGLDSLMAAHLLVEYELVAGITVDYEKITPDWVEFTIGELHEAVLTWT